MFLNVLKTFSSSTTIHGFSYIAHPSSHKVEKIFWTISILTSFILTAFLIHKLILEGQKNPTIIYTDQNVINVEDLNFPAVSLCLGIVYNTSCQTVIDYDEIKQQLENRELEIDNLTMDELKLVQILSLVARDKFMSSNFPSLKISTDDFIDKLELFDETFPVRTYEYLMAYNPEFKGVWINKFLVDVTKVLSKEGICYTFNMPDRKQIYRPNTAHWNFYKPKFDQLGSANPDLNLKNVSTPYPQKAQKPGLGLLISLRSIRKCIMGRRGPRFNHFKSSVPKSINDGFRLKFHDPYKVLSDSALSFPMTERKDIILKVTPKIMRVDESIKVDGVDERNCYLPHERQLKFFKVYNKVNCEHECLAEMTLNFCKCVQFFMARNLTTKICGSSDEKCFLDVEDQFEDTKSTCRCFEACETVEYEIEVQRIDESYEKWHEAKDSYQAKIDFTNYFVYPLVKRKTFSVVEFFSFIGGILGLLAGFSFMSGIEIVYYFLVVPMIELNKRNDTKVYPFVKAKSSKRGSREVLEVTTRYIKHMLESSSIHSFSQIGSDGKNAVERLTWCILFALSLVSTAFMVQDVYKTYKDAKISIRLDGSTTKVENIPFPAITIVRDLELRVDEFCPDRYTNLVYYDPSYVEHLFDEFARSICMKFDMYTMYPEPFQFENHTDLMQTLKYYTMCQRRWLNLRNGTWNKLHYPPFTRVLTSTVYGYAYNLIGVSKLLNKKEVSPEFHYYYYNYGNNITYPWKTSARLENGLSVLADMTDKYKIFDEQDKCLGTDTMIIHPPNELPLRMEQNTIKRSHSYNILLTPEIIKADEDLRSLNVNIRKCYFEDERKLKFFKIYTQKNCELECISYIARNKCRCIPYNYIRDSTAPVCDQYSTNNCISEIESFVNFTAYDDLYKTNNVCKCLPLCSYIKYNYEVYSLKLTKDFNRNHIKINVGWKDDDYYALVRYQQLRLVDFLAYVGGILGLFAGISVLSIFEVFYFLTLRLLTKSVRFCKG